MNETRLDTFAGTWLLLPELCVYDEGRPPEHAIYRIDQTDDEVRILMTWQPADTGEPQTAIFAGRPDGQVRPIPAAPHLTGLSITRVDERTLETAAWDDDDLVSFARRTASNDGTLLVVVQTATPPDGPAVRTFQVYRRHLELEVAT